MSKKLNPKQRRAARLLACGETQTSIAHQLRMRPETLSRWKKQPAFQQEFEKHMDAARDMVRHRITHLMDASITAVWAELQSFSGGPTRLRAALSMLKMVGFDAKIIPNDAAIAPKQIETAPEAETQR